MPRGIEVPFNHRQLIKVPRIVLHFHQIVLAGLVQHVSRVHQVRGLNRFLRPFFPL